MEGHCSTGQSPQWAVVPMEEEEEEEVGGGGEEEKEEEEGGGGRGGGGIVIACMPLMHAVFCMNSNVIIKAVLPVRTF